MTANSPSQYRIFVCTKQRSADHPEGCCTNAGSELLYCALQTELAHQGLNPTVKLQRSGCLDRCTHGPVILVVPPKSAAWNDQVTRFLLRCLPTKIQIKLRQWLFPQRITYGQLSPTDVPQFIQQQIIQGKILKPFQI
jgi:(2Fe-2S) ferredoxin